MARSSFMEKTHDLLWFRYSSCHLRDLLPSWLWLTLTKWPTLGSVAFQVYSSGGRGVFIKFFTSKWHAFMVCLFCGFWPKLPIELSIVFSRWFNKLEISQHCQSFCIEIIMLLFWQLTHVIAHFCQLVFKIRLKFRCG